MTPVLYILMRNDLPSMNAGKAMAQASHASNAMVHNSDCDAFRKSVKEWQGQTAQGFGTVLVLAANKAETLAVLDAARAMDSKFGNFLSDKVIDPTYPYRVDGETAQLIPSDIWDTAPRPEITDPKATYTLCRAEMTCAYVFGYKEEIERAGFLSHLKLHP